MSQAYYMVTCSHIWVYYVIRMLPMHYICYAPLKTQLTTKKREKSTVQHYTTYFSPYQQFRMFFTCYTLWALQLFSSLLRCKSEYPFCLCIPFFSSYDYYYCMMSAYFSFLHSVFLLRFNFSYDSLALENLKNYCLSVILHTISIPFIAMNTQNTSFFIYFFDLILSVRIHPLPSHLPEFTHFLCVYFLITFSAWNAKANELYKAITASYTNASLNGIDH